jgi:hypothetical protein
LYDDGLTVGQSVRALQSSTKFEVTVVGEDDPDKGGKEGAKNGGKKQRNNSGNSKRSEKEKTTKTGDSVSKANSRAASVQSNNTEKADSEIEEAKDDAKIVFEEFNLVVYGLANLSLN